MQQNTVLRSEDLRAQNRLRLLEILRSHGEPIDRTRLSEASGLSQSSLTKMCSELTYEGILSCSKPTRANAHKRGRPLSSYALAAEAAVAAIVSITKESIRSSLIDYSGATIRSHTRQFVSSETSKCKFIGDITNGIESLMSANSAYGLKHIGVSIQGPVDSNKGSLIWSSTIPLRNVLLSERLSKSFHVPVSVDNDCKYIAHALYNQKKHILGESFAAISISHGVGLGIYLNGESLKGAYSSAMEIGHINHKRDGDICRCGKKGCIEAYAADYAIYRRANGKSANTPTVKTAVNPETMHRLVRSAKYGDSASLAAFSEAARAVNTAISTIYSMFDPIPIAVLGYSAETWNLMASEIAVTRSSISSGSENYSHLFHHFENSEELRLSGLAIAAAAELDKVFAHSNTIHHNA